MREGRLRRDAEAIFRAALEAADPYRCVRGALEGLDLPEGWVFVVGMGKASVPMARAVEEVLAGRIAGGAVVTKYGHGGKLGWIKVHEAGHPIPDEAGIRAAGELLEIARGAGEEDLVLCLISGGGSALTPLPAEGVTLEEKQRTTELLLCCGARVEEINALRKHLSRIKGGQLAKAAHPARVISLILSDVVGDSLEVIASGPTVPDPTTFGDCVTIARKYDIWRYLPETVRFRLEWGARGEVSETPKPGDPTFSRCENILVGNNRRALDAARSEAERRGYRTLLLTSMLQGEAREVAKFLAAVVREVRASGNPVRPPACLLSGGETTVTVRGKGEGGRNQELALAMVRELTGLEGVVALSAGTDGTDGPTDAAGAFVDGETLKRAQALGLEPEAYLRENDSYNFFRVLGDLWVTGPTGTNVMDLQIALVG
ncbi:MAG TPA: glycerate kinase [Candidatus Latescibacteria bacterium]|nr:glycerate kinase [Candidatus Latescibacterota bacterium]